MPEGDSCFDKRYKWRSNLLVFDEMGASPLNTEERERGIICEPGTGREMLVEEGGVGGGGGGPGITRPRHDSNTGVSNCPPRE